MTNRVEKLSLLSEMISLSLVEKSLKPLEYNFLKIIAKQLDISKEDFDYLIENPINYTNLKSYGERILQFHRLALLLNEDGKNSKKEFFMLHDFGLHMGLSFISINRVLDLMESFPNRMVPAGVLIDIFKVQYN